MSHVKIEPYSLRLIMPSQMDFGGQISNAFPNMGFDETKSLNDPETGTPLLELARKFGSRDVSHFLESAQQQNEETRKWLTHLFAGDYVKIANDNRAGYWRHLAYFPNTDSFDLCTFNEKFTSQATGPHIAIEDRDGLTIMRIKEESYEALYRRTREKIDLALTML